jgi:hypothetical protein
MSLKVIKVVDQLKLESKEAFADFLVVQDDATDEDKDELERIGGLSTAKTKVALGKATTDKDMELIAVWTILPSLGPRLPLHYSKPMIQRTPITTELKLMRPRRSWQ